MTEKMDEVFEELRRQYLAEAPARLGELRKDLAALRAGEADAEASLKTRFHRLAGSGGSYGFPAITTASRDAERWIAEHADVDDAGFALLGASIGRIAAAYDDAAREVGLPADGQKRPPFGWRAHLVGGATDLAARLSAALRDAQFAVTVAPIDADPSAIPVSERPEIVILIPGPDEDVRAAVERWTTGPFERHLKVALVAAPSAADPLLEPYSRLDLIVTPPSADSEISRWARAVSRAAASPALVLVIAEDEAERAMLVAWLEGADLRVSVVASAREASEALGKELPDIILMDWELGQGGGAALVRIIRRSPRLALTPVVAIANSEGDEVRDLALEAGVDDLIARPLTQGRLLPSVLHRAARSRRLDEAVRRDPLSGFLTVGTLLDELEALMAYARREGERISFLMLDVDHFRRVNEQLGHQTGDQVLAQVTRVIRDRVRASDLAVRMGGEEFGVLFRHCGPADALAVGEKIRAAVVSSPVVVEGTPMPVHLSGGVASYPEHAVDLRELIRAAERALRRAKESGRDRIAVAG